MVPGAEFPGIPPKSKQSEAYSAGLLPAGPKTNPASHGESRSTHDMPSFVVCRGQFNRPAVSKSVGRSACLATMVLMKKEEDVTAFLVYCLLRARVASRRALVIKEKTKQKAKRRGRLQGPAF